MKVEIRRAGNPRENNGLAAFGGITKPSNGGLRLDDRTGSYNIRTSTLLGRGNQLFELCVFSVSH
jgi:hypothetical protein